jgi:hypothetical protein
MSQDHTVGAGQDRIVESAKDAQIWPDSALSGATQADPWIHRAKHMKCVTCMHYAQKMNGGPPRPEIGRCRRRAPTMNGYPVVFPADWCGDHKLDETK